MPDVIRIELITTMSLRVRENVARLLAAFEAIPELRPTHWGPDERARNPYNHQEFVDAISAVDSMIDYPGIQRRKPPRYEAYFSASNQGVKYIKVKFDTKLRPQDPALIFQLGDALAEAAQAEFGFVHPVWRLGEESQQYGVSGMTNAREFQEYGPRAVCARTWFGPHLTRLIGRERLLQCDTPVQELAWGAIQVDLIGQPWEADFATLAARQQVVMAYLRPAGVFFDYTHRFDRHPAPNWQPLPV